MRDHRLRIEAPRRTRMPPIILIAPGAQPRRGNPQLLGNLAQRPTAARQQPHRLPLEFLRELTTRCTHQTPSYSQWRLPEVSTISREGHILLAQACEFQGDILMRTLEQIGLLVTGPPPAQRQ